MSDFKFSNMSFQKPGKFSVVIAPLVLFLILLIPAIAFSQTLEEKIKSVFIYKFTRFIKWPANENNITAPKVIGIVQNDQIYKLLNSIISDQNDSSVTVKRLNRLEEYESVDILVIPNNLIHKWQKVGGGKSDLTLFTICDDNKTPLNGCMFDLVKKDGKVAFNANLVSIQHSKIKISSHLMRIANKVWGQANSE